MHLIVLQQAQDLLDTRNVLRVPLFARLQLQRARRPLATAPPLHRVQLLQICLQNELQCLRPSRAGMHLKGSSTVTTIILPDAEPQDAAASVQQHTD